MAGNNATRCILAYPSSFSGLRVIAERQGPKEGTYDFDLLNAAYLLGTQNRDAELIIQSLELRQKSFQGGTVDTFLKLADVYANLKKDDARALAYYRSALAAAPASSRESIRQQIPQAFVSRL